ncbi:MAG: hypothetical protein IJ161_06920 [Bacteroidales bacterium]|nr:hypothetical protein [Bacteroidales bacterium]
MIEKTSHLPQYIIDLVGTLFDEGMDDERICQEVIRIRTSTMGYPDPSVSSPPASAASSIRSVENLPLEGISLRSRESR